MIHIINPELFQITTNERENEKGSYFQTVVASAMKVKRGKNDKYASNQILTTINCPVEDYNSTKTVVQMVEKNGKCRTTVRANDKNKYDTEVYLIAIPFNGFIGKITDSKFYRIYRGLIVKSFKKDIEWNGELYTKCAYMVVTPNHLVFNEDHKHHTDCINLSIETYCLNTNKNDPTDVKTVKTTVTTSFYKDNSEVRVVNEEVDPVNPEDFKGKEIFPLYQLKQTSDVRKSKKTKEHMAGTGNNPHPQSEGKQNLDQMIDKANKDFASRYGNRSKDRKKRR